MGKVSISENAQWKSAEMSSGDFGDDLLQFLGSFEEMLPENVESESGGNEKKKKGKQKKSKQTQIKEDKEDGMTAEERKLEKKKKRKEQMIMNRKLKKERIAKRKLKEKETQETSISKDSAVVKEDDENKPPKGKKRKAESNGNKENEAKKQKKNDNNAVVNEKQSKDAVDISAWKEFYFLPQPIFDAISDLGYSTPTEIQSSSLYSAVRDRQDVLGAAETGSGKTLAFAIPMICRLLDLDETSGEENKGLRGLIVAPTRELVIQIMKHVNALVKHTRFKATSIVGGLAQVKQERIIAQQCPDIVVATPGRLWSMMENADKDSYFGNLSNLACLVVDETDRMVEEGYFQELTHILNKVHSEANRQKLQTLVFSATLTFARAQNVCEEEKKTNRILSSQQKIQRLIKLTGLRENKHRVIDLTRQMGTAGSLVEARINCSSLLDKDTNLVYLLNRYPGRTIVFVNSIDAARRLYSILQNVGISPMILHAKMIQKQRLRNLEKFTESSNAVLLATDVAARGLDIQGIDHVIHYQVPKKAETYIHRSGRTARASQRGLTVLLVDLQSKQFYVKLCSGLNRMEDLDIFPIDFEPLLRAIRKRVKLASEIDTLGFRCKKIRMSESWFEKAAREADLDYDETRCREMDGLNMEVDKMMTKMRQLQSELRDELRTSLPKPDGSDSIKTKYITPDIIAKLNSVGNNAIDVLQQKKEETKEWKRKSRKAAREMEKSTTKHKLKNKLKNKQRAETKLSEKKEQTVVKNDE